MHSSSHSCRLILAALVATGCVRWTSSVFADAPPAVQTGESPSDQSRKSDTSTDDTSARDAAIAAKVAPAFVQVEYKLKVDKGEQPYGGAVGQRCPSCGQFHGSNLADLITQERPLETIGFAVAADEIVAPDALLNDRFIESIQIRVNDQVVPARVVKVFSDRRAVLLKSEKPMEGVTPLSFADAAGPFVAVMPTQAGGAWRYSVKGYGDAPIVQGKEKRIVDIDNPAVIVNKDGVPVTIGFAQAVKADDSWKASPSAWAGVSKEELAGRLDALKSAAASRIVRVHLSFRSPRNTNEPTNRYRFRAGDQESDATERDVLGVVVGPQRVMVLADLNQDATARLTRITVHPEGSKAVPATFVSSFKDHAALIVAPEQEMPASVELADDLDPWVLQGRLFHALEVDYQGEQRVTYADHRWINDVELGWRRRLVPTVAGAGKRPLFLFDESGKLVAMPIKQRDTNPEDYSTPEAIAVLTTYLRPMFSQPETLADAANVPLSEEDELRTAWLGVELQSLTQELARLNKVSELTSDGESGGLVTYVYPGSPAEKMGIKPGAILLRLYTPDRPAPVDVKVDANPFSDQPFPWERLSELPEQYFDQIPRPWPAVQTMLAKELTKVGFGRQVELEYAQGGTVSRTAIAVEQSPAHFDTAKRFDHKPSGLSVRDMTFELRRFFQMNDGDPGVVISMIDAGSRASRVGLKPFEYITSVNGVDVRSIDDFRNAVAPGGELKLGVKRFRTGRVVTVKVDVAAPASSQPTTAATTLPAAATQPVGGPASSATKPWSPSPAN